MGSAQSRFRRREEAAPTQNQAFQIDRLPERALRCLFEFLDMEDQKHMRELCKGMLRVIDKEYGIHARFPARHWADKQTCNACKPFITDKMITNAMKRLEGKVIRSLEMIELHPDFDPFPFQQLIQYPLGLVKVSLKYVDVGFLITLLYCCRNLADFSYVTGVHRQIQGVGIQPVPTPREKEELIEFITRIPPDTFQVDKLTSLWLCIRLEKINPPEVHSDWANVIFLLLALSQRELGTLNSFKFEFEADRYSNLKDPLQIVACVGHFLTQCPNLRELKYSSNRPARWSEFEMGWVVNHEQMRAPPLPQNVFSGLIKKYGSAQLKAVEEAAKLGLIMIPCLN